MADIQSNLVPFLVSPDNVTFYSLVCKKAWGFDGTTPTTEEESDCGPHTGLSANKWSVNFDILFKTDPSGTQKSGGDMLAYWDAQQLMYVLMKYPSDTGAEFYIKGPAYITTFSIKNTVGSLMSATGTLTGSGPVDISAPALAFDTELEFSAAVSDDGPASPDTTHPVVTGTVGAIDADQLFEFNALAGGSGILPRRMDIFVATVAELVIDYTSARDGDDFLYTDKAGVTHAGVFTDGDVNF